MEILRELSLLWSLFHILILFMMLYRSRYPRRKTLFLTGITMIPLITLNLAGVAIYGAQFMGKIFILTCTLPSLFVFWFISEDKKGRFFFTFCLADTVALWIIAATNVADFYFGGGQCILMFISRMIMFPLVEWIAIRHLRKPYLELQGAVASGWGIFAGMTALYYILLAVFANFPVIITARPQELPTFLLVLMLMPMTYATILTALYRQLLLYRRQQSERILQEQKHALEVQLENQQRIRRMKHDMKGYAVTLSGLLAEGKIQEAQEYLNAVRTEMDSLLGQFCANPYINAIFVQYSQKFQEIHADFQLDICIGDEELPYMDLCRILANGLENAYDALEALKVQEREISVQMKYSRDYLVIRIRNRCQEDLRVEKGAIPPSSKGGREHGFGLATVKEAAERLGGDMLCYTENHNFVLDVMVRIKNLSI